MWEAPKTPVDVRARLVATPVRGTKGLRPGQCEARFWLQPQVFVAGRWQGGESLGVRRDGADEYKIGCLPVMTMEQAACYVEQELTRYHWPYFGAEAWQHPFTYQI